MSWEEDASWRPIGTAPRDGSRIELLIPYARDKFSEAECTDEGDAGMQTIGVFALRAMTGRTISSRHTGVPPQ